MTETDVESEAWCSRSGEEAEVVAEVAWEVLEVLVSVFGLSVLVFEV